MRKICLIFIFLNVAFGDIADKFAQECENGDVKICTLLARSYESGLLNNELPFAYEKVFLKNECEKNDALSCALYTNHFDKKDEPQIWKKALEVEKKECESGSAKGCDYTGHRYDHYEHYFGEKLENNREIAEQYYEKAKGLYEKECKNGVAYSCLQIWELTTRKMMNRDEAYGEKMLEKAHQIYEKECESGIDNIESCIKRIYNPNKPYKKFIPMLKTNCEKGSLYACKTLLNSKFYDHQVGKKRLKEKEIQEIRETYLSFLEKSCENGSAEGCLDLSRVYKDFNFGIMDFTKAEQVHKKSINLFAKECDKGDRSSCLAFSRQIGYSSIPFEKNENLAKKYYEKACELGETLACKALDK
ncbi:hypothetical protein [Campylobacter sp. JMF_08 NE1]|uniref:hypothetical protein n=1 Tax=Campylobacter sp. JMF_08 NE1 TaxID=2983821 RepID=UPI0022E9AAE7|nr:hypothetical protein [Campylobacter sp. JMF_08 NE1]MDA3047864.1 hypothetical protein [Campylobacter sp. JMF_08 NE1]